MPSTSPEPRPIGRTPSPARAAAEPQGPSLSLGDIYYTLFRHKWKILVCGLLGTTAAVAAFLFNPRYFASEAKLFIRYVIEARSAASPSEEARTKSPDQRGETIIASEIQILTSLDLASQVAAAIGPEKILGVSPQGASISDAALVIARGLAVSVPAKSSVIEVSFRHRDPALVQPVLREIIERYLKKHVETHRAVGLIGDSLTQETDQLRTRLAQTEEELRRAQSKAGVISLEDSRKAFSDQINRLRQGIMDAQAELAEREATLQEMTATSPAVQTQPEEGARPALPPDQVLEEYGRLSARLDLAHKNEQDLLARFTPESAPVKEARAQIVSGEAARAALEQTHPGLVLLRSARPAAKGAAVTSFDLVAESARLKALRAKTKVFQAQLEQTRAEVAALDQMEAAILELRRKKEIEEANFRYLASRLDRSRIDDALGAGQVSNINQIQAPSLPARESGKTMKLVAGFLAAGCALGLAWAFATELFLDQSIKRPADFERKLNIPLFISIPEVDRQYHRRLAKTAGQKLLGGPKTSDQSDRSDTSDGTSTALATQEEERALQPFYATLRDRLIGYFENQGLTHKPKLVAVTGLSHNSGVTTTAAGLAQSLSETGEGNVLLVDMTAEQGSAQQFFKGKAMTGLDELLETKERAPVQENLYVVSEGSNSDRLSRNLPQRFTKLVPKLKASDFDYIIFDMPNVSQVSITPRLAGFMDMVLLVIESEKTDAAIVERATALLAESKAHVGAVLNKTKNYVPRGLHQDTLSDL